MCFPLLLWINFTDSAALWHLTDFSSENSLVNSFYIFKSALVHQMECGFEQYLAGHCRSDKSCFMRFSKSSLVSVVNSKKKAKTHVCLWNSWSDIRSDRSNSCRGRETLCFNVLSHHTDLHTSDLHTQMSGSILTGSVCRFIIDEEEDNTDNLPLKGIYPDNHLTVCCQVLFSVIGPVKPHLAKQ